MRDLASSAGRRLRPHVASLTGQPALVERVDECIASLERHVQRVQEHQALLEAQGAVVLELQAKLLEVEANVCSRLDVMWKHLEELGVAQDVGPALASEIDRLDGYLVYHTDAIRETIAQLESDGAARVRGTEADRVGLDAPPMITTGQGLDVIVCSREFDLIVPTREEGLLAYLARHGTETTEPGVHAVLTSLVRPGDVAVDVGANIGLHSVGMGARVGPAGRLICFEPLPHLVAALERTLRLNGLGDRSEVHAIALSDSSGTAEIFAAQHSPLSSLFPLPEGTRSDVRQVPVARLDDLVPPGGRVDVVKIDVEGAEPRVWRGMKRVRDDNHRLAVVLEWSASHFSRAGEEPVAFMREILADGFTASTIDDDPSGLGPLSIDDVADLEARNVLLLRGH
ncbi:MAG TPA: FkbM family methyltransferase [Acidimicrobiia bacterium]|jgi:FkbM family methyltransferase